MLHARLRVIRLLPGTVLLCSLAGLAAAELWHGPQAINSPLMVPADHFSASWRKISGSTGAASPALAEAILARPLFSPGRRPPRPARALEAHEAAFRLSGVIIDGTNRRAIFVGPGGKTIIATAGTLLGTWTISAVSEGDVSLTGPAGSRHLQLAFASAPAAAPTPAPEPDPTSVAMAASRRALLKLLDADGLGRSGDNAP